MTPIPVSVAMAGIGDVLDDCLTCARTGSVWRYYNLPDSRYLLAWPSDLVKLWGFTLQRLIPGQAQVLAATTAFWAKRLKPRFGRTAVVASSEEIDRYLPSGFPGLP